MSQLSILLRNITSNTTLRFIVCIIILGTLSALLDIPVLRELMVVPFLLILPGLLLLFLLKLDKLGLAEKIVLTVALSVTFIMFFGVALNQICLAINYSKPLATNTFVPSLSMVLVVLTILAYQRNKQAFASFPFHIKLNNRSVNPIMMMANMYVSFDTLRPNMTSRIKEMGIRSAKRVINSILSPEMFRERMPRTTRRGRIAGKSNRNLLLLFNVRSE